MIQEIAPKKLYNEYENREPSKEDLVFIFWGRSFLGRYEEELLVLPTVEQIKQSESYRNLENETNWEYLFRIDEQAFFLAFLPEDYELKGFERLSTQEYRKMQPQELSFAGMTAYHLYVWYRDHRFCGRCGGRTISADDERALVCTECGNRLYPIIMPAVIVGVINGDKILTTRYAGRSYKGYALIAGFCEIGESVEETVAREVMEEVGVKVKNIRYYKSQPWGIAYNLLLGYYCDLDGDDTLTPDEDELAVAAWTSRDEIEGTDTGLSLTHEMIEIFRRGELLR